MKATTPHHYTCKYISCLIHPRASRQWKRPFYLMTRSIVLILVIGKEQLAPCGSAAHRNSQDPLVLLVAPSSSVGPLWVSMLQGLE